METLEIRRMTDSDIDTVWQMERDLFAMAWPKTSFLFDVGDRRVSYPIVGIEDGQIAGYAVAWFVNEELHIGNVAVARPRQGKGIGRRLLERLLEEAAQRKAKRATLEVRMSNVRAIRLYRKYGFKGVAIRRHYYTDNGEDALVMSTDIESPGGEREYEKRG
jgi:ribosomal-protein-alanine N-acetyltransferase